MTKMPVNGPTAREVAEELLVAEGLGSAFESQANELLHEFRVQQIELEMQNEELRRVRAVLDDVRRQYRDLYDFAPVGYLTISNTGLIVEANHTAAALLRFEREELLQQPFDAFVVPAQRSLAHRLFVRLTQHVEEATFDLSLNLSTGGSTDFRVNGKRVALEGEMPGVRLTLTNITELKHVEMELRNSEALRRATMDSVAAEIVVLDRNGIIVAVNAPWRRFILENGIEPGVVVTGTDVGANYLAACHEKVFGSTDEAVSAREGIRQVIDGRLPGFKLEYSCHSAQQERWFSMNVTPLGLEEGGVVVAHIDITDRKQAELAAVKSRARLHSIIEAAMDAIITVDEAQNIVLFNSAAESIFGWPRAEVIGKPLDLLIPERLRAGHANHIKEYGNSGKSPRHMDGYRTVGALHRSGNEFLINASISKHTDDGARFYTVILRDVTKEARNEDNLRELQANMHNLAVASNLFREQEKRRIARELHDELGQAMTALKMDTAWIMEHVPAEQKTVIAKLARMQGTLDETVAAMRRIAANLRPLILDDLGFVPAVESLVDSFKEHNRIGCQLSIADTALDLPEPYATEIFRILQESLTNVAKHAEASLVEISIHLQEGELCMTIRDNGKGFDITDPRKPEAYGHMGVVERAYLMHGDISIDSAPGQGTLVRLHVPITPTEPSE